MSGGYTTVLFPSGIGADFKPAYDEAVAFWNAVVTAGAQPLVFEDGFDAKTSQCDVDYQFPPGFVLEGLTIFASSPLIDGEGQILGRAGPCYLPRGSDFPRLGIMEFDSADSAALLASGQFAAVVVHEMGHVLGIGGLWPLIGALQDPCPLFLPFPCDPYYIGEHGVEGYQQLNPPTELGPLPAVANTGGLGTANAHWREATFNNELMSGYLNAGIENPLSIMTIKSMIDLGYSVDLSQAQSYVIPAPNEEREAELKAHLMGDVMFFDLDAEVPMGLPEIEEEVEYEGLFMLVLAGFIFLAGLQFYLHKSTKKAIMKVHQEKLQVSNVNPMHLNELA